MPHRVVELYIASWYSKPLARHDYRLHSPYCHTCRRHRFAQIGQRHRHPGHFVDYLRSLVW